MTHSTWINEPTVLFHKDFILELWPLESYSYAQKINAITRIILVLSIIGLIVTNSYFIIVIAIIALATIAYLSKSRYAESFETISKSDLIDTVKRERKVLKSDYQPGTSNNPFSNVLLTDINDSPDKKPGPPSFIKEVDQDIKKNIKNMVSHNNPHIKPKEQQDLWEEFQNERANHAFYTTSNSSVVNDQGALGNYLYGNMHSSKESNADGSLMRIKNTARHTLF